jgi:nitrate reductase NapE component
VSNTQPTKNHNTENKKGEQYLTNQKSQHRTFLVFYVVIFGWLSIAHLFSFLCCDFWLVECSSPF